MTWIVLLILGCTTSAFECIFLCSVLPQRHGDVVWFMYQELNSISDFEESDQTFKLAEEREVIRGTVKSTLFYSHLRYVVMLKLFM